MADNLSSLLADAFTIYSESYTKIGELGVKVVNADNGANQPKLIKKLIACTRLYRVITDSVTLNGGETAIVGIVGDIATINNLLLKLKRCVGLYEVPVFPTPLTSFVFNLGSGSGGADVDATYITVNPESGLPFSRRLLASGLGLADGGPSGDITISLDYLNVSTVDVSGGTLTMDMNGGKERLFIGGANITGAKTWALSNAASARRLAFNFVISGLTPGGTTHDQTMPATWKMSDGRWTTATKKWRPIEDGEYQAVATTYDGVNYKLEIGDVIT